MPQDEKRQLFMPPPTQDDLNPSGLPHSLEIIGEFLDQIHAPDESFDPDGWWKGSYRVLMALRGGFDKSWKAGALKISRRLSGDGSIELDVKQSITTEWYVFFHNTAAHIACHPDQLATPRSWKLDSVILDQNKQPIHYMGTSISGSSKGSIVTLDGRKTGLGKRFTSNWSLFDAVQRLPFAPDPVAFDLLDDLEKPKRSQKICYSGSTEVKLGGKMTRLHSFIQTGEGITPHTYWLDDHHRLLILICGLVVYFYDAEASLVEEKQ